MTFKLGQLDRILRNRDKERGSHVNVEVVMRTSGENSFLNEETL